MLYESFKTKVRYRQKELDRDNVNVGMDHFPCDITRMWKFDYYSVDHTWGGSTRFKCLTFYGENPTSTCIPACKLRLEIATHERTALFVEQRECFHLPFVTTSCDLPSWRYSLLEITLSFHNAQSVPLLVSRLLYKGLWSVMAG